MTQERITELCTAIQEIFSEVERAGAEHTVWRTRRNARVLTLLRAIEIFAGGDRCPVCGSPPKWDPNKAPKDKQRQDLHDDKCELDILIRHFESCLEGPGLW